jgi:hypothetical protein
MSFHTPTSVVLMLGLAGVLLCIASYVAFLLRPRMWPVLAFGALAFVLGAVPSALNNGVHFDEGGFEQRSGWWMEPRLIRMRWADIKSMHMERGYDPEQSLGKRRKKDILVVDLKDGTSTSFVAYRSWRDHWTEIHAFIAQRGITLESR